MNERVKQIAIRVAAHMRALGLTGLVVFLSFQSAAVWAAVALIVLGGAIGALAGFRLHGAWAPTNPYAYLAGIQTASRRQLTVGVVCGGGLLALALFWQGMGVGGAFPRLGAVLTGLANLVFCFSGIYGIVGALRISDARHMLSQANFDTKQKWRAEFASQPVSSVPFP